MLGASVSQRAQAGLSWQQQHSFCGCGGVQTAGSKGKAVILGRWELAGVFCLGSMFWGSGGSLGSSYQKWKAQSCINRKLWAMVEIFYPKLWETCTGPCLSLSEYRVVLFLVSCSGKERGCRVQDLSSYTIVIIILKCTHSLHFFLPEMTCLFMTRQLCSVRKLRCQSAL